MGNGGCVDGQLVTILSGSPVPLIGLYIAVATLDNESNLTSIMEAAFRQNTIGGAMLSLMFLEADPLNHWISIKAESEMTRWKNKYERDTQPTHLIQLISKWPIFASNKSECGALFIRKLEAKGEGFLQGSTDTAFLREIFEIEYKYKVSCISILVLSRILEELMPSSRGESLMHSLKALDESFESICFVDQKITDTPNMLDEARWMSANDVWAQCENPNHWFQTKIISPAFKSFSLKKSESLQLHSALGCLEHAAQAVKKEFRQNFKEFRTFPVLPLAEKHMGLIAMEFVIICEFLQEQNYESVNHLFDFLEMCFVKMLCSTLSSLPLAIMKELEDGDNPTELSEGRVRKALKFLHVLELLEGRIEWSWPPKFDPKSRQANDVQAEPNQTTRQHYYNCSCS
ncbi:uncharacterized protein LOC122058956 isoform X2 [Macadamia integrifolia]|uniref:uncharacterized protein LOC122058956 isoform X2 n=1 Tax=Macadamia integrifolia TaxID=60698 RepID=UPI001C5298D8|nr:uncharacterized protein LOC122058956 isoform X2 [Macadamia integrifolia]